MKVNFDATRIAHLLALLFFTYLGGRLLVSYLEWTPLSAYGLSCTVSVQINNAILFLKEGGSLSDLSDNIKDDDEKKERRGKKNTEGIKIERIYRLASRLEDHGGRV